MKTLLCKFGFHSYEVRIIWEDKRKVANLAYCYLEGRVCKKCNKVHPEDAYQSRVISNFANGYAIWKL